uniref:Uncharacterized protein n=1 Tax=Ixodes ricinus TaxID=34613 RepID=A0A090XBR6_IXORI
MSLEDPASFTDSPRRSPLSGGDPSTKHSPHAHTKTRYTDHRNLTNLSNTGRGTTWACFFFSNSDFASHVAREPPGYTKICPNLHPVVTVLYRSARYKHARIERQFCDVGHRAF